MMVVKEHHARREVVKHACTRRIPFFHDGSAEGSLGRGKRYELRWEHAELHLASAAHRYWYVTL